MEQNNRYKSYLTDLILKKEGLSIINKHLEKSISESEEATKKIIENITYALSLLEENRSFLDGHIYSMEIQRIRDNEISVSSNLTEILTLLEFQDILAQRLKKISQFLSELESELEGISSELDLNDSKLAEKTKELKKKLEALEWKREVNQQDVDEIFEEYGI